jgi:hypothetical protein
MDVKTYTKTHVKPIVNRHSTAVRVGLFCTIIVIVVALHEPHVSLLVFFYKAMDECADVIADRVFPATWFHDSD